MIIPLGVAKQIAVDETGSYVDKFCVTHDCSYKYSFGESPNSSIAMDILPDCRYGKAFIRFLNQIYALREKFPSKKIFLVKIDLDAAYCRVHVTPEIAIKQISVMIRLLILVVDYHSDQALLLHSIVQLVMSSLPYLMISLNIIHGIHHHFIPQILTNFQTALISTKILHSVKLNHFYHQFLFAKPS